MSSTSLKCGKESEVVLLGIYRQRLHEITDLIAHSHHVSPIKTFASSGSSGSTNHSSGTHATTTITDSDSSSSPIDGRKNSYVKPLTLNHSLSPEWDLTTLIKSTESVEIAANKEISKVETGAKRSSGTSAAGLVSWIKKLARTGSSKKLTGSSKALTMLESLLPSLSTTEREMQLWLMAIAERKELTIQHSTTMVQEMETSIALYESYIDCYDEIINETLKISFEITKEISDLRIAESFNEALTDMFALALTKKLSQPGICLLFDEQEQGQRPGRGQGQVSNEFQLQYIDENDVDQKGGYSTGKRMVKAADIDNDDHNIITHDAWPPPQPQPTHAMSIMMAIQSMNTVPRPRSESLERSSDDDNGIVIVDRSNSIRGSSNNNNSDMNDGMSRGRKDDELQHGEIGAGDDEDCCYSTAVSDFAAVSPPTTLLSISSSSPPPDSSDDHHDSNSQATSASHNQSSGPRQSPPGSPLLQSRHKGAFGSPSPLPPAVSAVPAVWHGIKGSNMKRHMHVNFLIDLAPASVPCTPSSSTSPTASESISKHINTSSPTHSDNQLHSGKHALMMQLHDDAEADEESDEEDAFYTRGDQLSSPSGANTTAEWEEHNRVQGWNEGYGGERQATGNIKSTTNTKINTSSQITTITAATITTTTETTTIAKVTTTTTVPTTTKPDVTSSSSSSSSSSSPSWSAIVSLGERALPSNTSSQASSSSLSRPIVPHQAFPLPDNKVHNPVPSRVATSTGSLFERIETVPPPDTLFSASSSHYSSNSSSSSTIIEKRFEDAVESQAAAARRRSLLRSQSVPLSQLKLAQGSAPSPPIASSSSGSNIDPTHSSAPEDGFAFERGLGGSLPTSTIFLNAPATTAIRAADLAHAATATAASQEVATTVASSADANLVVNDAISLEMNQKMATFVTHKEDICALLKAMKHSRELEQQHLKGVKKLWRELKTQKNDVFSVHGVDGPVSHVTHGVTLYPMTSAVTTGGQGQPNTTSSSSHQANSNSLMLSKLNLHRSFSVDSYSSASNDRNNNNNYYNGGDDVVVNQSLAQTQGQGQRYSISQSPALSPMVRSRANTGGGGNGEGQGQGPPMSPALFATNIQQSLSSYLPARRSSPGLSALTQSFTQSLSHTSSHNQSLSSSSSPSSTSSPNQQSPQTGKNQSSPRQQQQQQQRSSSGSPTPGSSSCSSSSQHQSTLFTQTLSKSNSLHSMVSLGSGSCHSHSDSHGSLSYLGTASHEEEQRSSFYDCCYYENEHHMAAHAAEYAEELRVLTKEEASTRDMLAVVTRLVGVAEALAKRLEDVGIIKGNGHDTTQTNPPPSSLT